MSFFLSPIGNEQQFNANGNPLNAGRILTYLAGSTTPTATYTDNTGATPQANPIILNSLGLPASPVWLNGGITYKFVIQDANLVTLRTVDNISGINDTTATQTEWVSSGFVPTFISTVSFSVPGDQTGTLQIGRRLRTQNTAGLIYSRITNSVFAATITTVTVVNDSGVLDSGLSSVSYGLLSPVNPSLPNSAAVRTAMGVAASGANSDITSLADVTTVNGVAPLHLDDIVNGKFRIAQAGTSFAAPASGSYDLDGWLTQFAGAAVFTVAQAAGSSTGRLSRQATITTADAAVAAGDFVVDETRIEGYNIEKYVGQTFTIGFRAKVPVSGVHCVALRNSGSDRSYVKEISFTSANVWQDCSFTVTGGLPTAGTWNYTNGIGLAISFAHLCGATFQTTPDAWNTGNFVATSNQVNDCATIGNVWALENVTLNLGTVAAVSEIDVDKELLRCQRYYEYNGTSLIGRTTSTSHRFYWIYKTTKRTTPTHSLLSTTIAFEESQVATRGVTSAVLSGSTGDVLSTYIDITGTNSNGVPTAGAILQLNSGTVFAASARL